MKSKNTISICLFVLLISTFFIPRTLNAQKALSLNSRSEGNLRNPISQNAANSVSSAFVNLNVEGFVYSLGWFRPFELEELEERFIALHYSRKNYGFNASLWQSGDNLFNESIIQFGAQASLGAYSLGIKPIVQRITVQGFGNTLAYSIQGFVGFNLNEKWMYYLLIDWKSPSSKTLDQRFHNRATRIVGGFHYTLNSIITTGFELSQDDLNGLDFRIAQRLELIEHTLKVSTGYDVLRSMPTVGLVVQVKKLSIQLHYSFHPYLSSSTGGAVHYQPINSFEGI